MMLTYKCTHIHTYIIIVLVMWGLLSMYTLLWIQYYYADTITTLVAKFGSVVHNFVMKK